MNHPPSSRKLQFPTVMDWWVAFPVFLFLGMVLFSIPVSIAYAPTILTSVVVVAFLIGTFLIVVDKAFFTHYTLEREGLSISGQLYRVFIPYRAMKTIQNGSFRHLVTFRHHRRFALSSNCLVISLHESTWRTISVSPNHKQHFLDGLLTNIDKERTKRTTYGKAKRS